MSVEELHQCDGKARPTVYVAIKGLVFDVTASGKANANNTYTHT